MKGSEPLLVVDDDFEDEYPGASALATECFVNVMRTADLLTDLLSRYILDEHQLSQSALQVLAIIDGAGEPLEPTVIAERRLVTTGSMTSLLDNLEKRELIRRDRHPEDRRKLLVTITPAGQAIVDQVLPALHARERDVLAAALGPSEQRSLLKSLAKLQRAALRASSEPAPRGAPRHRSNGDRR